jgi:hypothetical protein
MTVDHIVSNGASANPVSNRGRMHHTFLSAASFIRKQIP